MDDRGARRARVIKGIVGDRGIEVTVIFVLFLSTDAAYSSSYGAPW